MPLTAGYHPMRSLKLRWRRLQSANMVKLWKLVRETLSPMGKASFRRFLANVTQLAQCVGISRDQTATTDWHWPYLVRIESTTTWSSARGDSEAIYARDRMNGEKYVALRRPRRRLSLCPDRVGRRAVEYGCGRWRVCRWWRISGSRRRRRYLRQRRNRFFEFCWSVLMHARYYPPLRLLLLLLRQPCKPQLAAAARVDWIGWIAIWRCFCGCSYHQYACGGGLCGLRSQKNYRQTHAKACRLVQLWRGRSIKETDWCDG